MTAPRIRKMNGRLHAAPIPCENDRPEIGRGARLVLASHEADDGGLVLCAGPEWVAKVIESRASRWKPHHYQLMKTQPPKRPYPLKAT